MLQSVSNSQRIDSFSQGVLYKIVPIFLSYYNISLFYRLRKINRNISINILGYEGKSFKIDIGL